MTENHRGPTEGSDLLTRARVVPDAAADDLISHLQRVGPDVRTARRLIAHPGPSTDRQEHL